MIKLLKEETTLVKPVSVDANVEEVDDKIAAVACEETVTGLMQQAWDFISSLNSVIATLDINYKEDSKKDVLELLNSIIDDTVISVGVLQKISNIMNSKKVELLDAGELKADEILTKASDSE